MQTIILILDALTERTRELIAALESRQSKYLEEALASEVNGWRRALKSVLTQLSSGLVVAHPEQLAVRLEVRRTRLEKHIAYTHLLQ
ncbi:MAG: hypothetical protein WA970_09050 [Gammaproteobacteria bacterium]